MKITVPLIEVDQQADKLTFTLTNKGRPITMPEAMIGLLAMIKQTSSDNKMDFIELLSAATQVLNLKPIDESTDSKIIV